jgi:hypothetical protein
MLRASDMARQRFSELGIKPERSQITPNEGPLPHTVIRWQSGERPDSTQSRPSAVRRQCQLMP